MIPSVLVSQIRRGIEEYLLTTFPVTNPFFRGSLEELLRREEGIFRGPYISLKRPFLLGDPGKVFFPDILPGGFRPYKHQQDAWERIQATRSTLVATGTGSGKTECYLYPILDHCLRHRGERGMKAIVVYPMNALASDQAKRFAAAIHSSETLRGNVRVGLVVGQNQDEASFPSMGADHVITDREALWQAPPDVLLTNYKMLDYLLVRPGDYPLWKENGPETLKFLVVDELHTFDGAQGTDLACLIRRLKARTKTPEGYLCCVGTSATLGTGEPETAEKLREFATQVFAEPFDEEAVIGEALQSVEAFLGDAPLDLFTIPAPEWRSVLDPLSYDDAWAYIKAQHGVWLGTEPSGTMEDPQWRYALGEALKRHVLLRQLLNLLQPGAVEQKRILDELEKTVPGGAGDRGFVALVLDSFLALVAVARTPGPTGMAPFLHLREQFWLREMRRMVGLVEKPEDRSPRLAFSDDLKPDQLKRSLPLIHCRECGVMGWGGYSKDHDEQIQADLKTFYTLFFGGDPRVCFLYPEMAPPGGPGRFSEFLCPGCLRLWMGREKEKCAFCGEPPERQLPVFRYQESRVDSGRRVGLHHCPFCGGHNSLTILGARAATLTSVAVSQLFTSTFNNDKKLLAFSDNVQDASHRAGFFKGRAFRFTFRSALQQALDQNGGPVPLDRLAELFVDHWKRTLGEAEFSARFLPPDMDWLEDYEHLRKEGSLPAGSDLPDLVAKRASWEIWSEYTFNARIGRTLEKVGGSVARARPEAIRAAATRLLARLPNEVGGYGTLTEEAVRGFLHGLILTLKNKGAVDHPDLHRYLDSGGDPFLLGHIDRMHKVLHMPAFGPQKRAPVFLASRGGGRFNLWVRSAERNTPTWYEDWLKRSLGMENWQGTQASYGIIVEELLAAGILFERQGQAGKVWGLKQDAFDVVLNVAQFKCSACSFPVSVAAADAPHWEGTPCLRYRCTGRMERVPDREDYYWRLYHGGDVQRVYAAEHTGLLEKTTRDELERAFMRREGQRRPGDPNVLSCTPTLEMGVDIGDLSTVLLCSVPPKPANYLQRGGRGGRTDGNAVVLTVANARPHDLFFYFEPEEMIQGHIEPPGCFLRATAVLERQFTAYVFDRWVESGIEPGALPAQLKVVLNAIASGGKGREAFPANLLHFFKSNRTSLEQDFLAIFGKDLEPRVQGHILAFSRGTLDEGRGLEFRISEGLQEVLNEREALKKRLGRTREHIQKLEAKSVRDEAEETLLRDLRDEKDALHEVIQHIEKKHVLNFFTDEGLLPNYAFPESGVVLRSVILRKIKRPGGGPEKTTSHIYEYERPASSAISELAPDNVFYAEGRKLKVDQVNVDLSEVQHWRFCASCHHMELDDAVQEPAPQCPACGNELWHDQGQRKSMLRMKQVVATTWDRDSRSYDDGDDREQTFFQKNMFVEVDKSNVTQAFAIENPEVPFGFEFLRKVTLREVNFGPQGVSGERSLIAGKELVAESFEICRDCGKVRPKRSQSGEPSQSIKHGLTCRFRDGQPGAGVFETCYLYRELSSEAIRMLLPVSTFEVEKGVHSFVAALELGLRRHFHGDPGHLLTTVYDEPDPETGQRRRYLVLYDAVPGGTGYLKDLMSSKTVLLDVFQRAYDVMAACPCQNEPDHDGCYRCLLAYHGRHDMQNSSRQRAMEMLSRILAHEDDLKPTDRISRIRTNALLESELEGLFIEALKRSVDRMPGGKLAVAVINGKPGWLLSTGKSTWQVEPQVPLGLADGVRVECRADFVFYPERSDVGQLPIAVFTDGFAYHADPEGTGQCLGKDTAQRMALIRSGRYRVWSLTYDDVDGQLKGVAHAPQWPIEPRRETVERLLAPLLPGEASEWSSRLSMGPFEQFLELLANPGPAWTQLASASVISWLDLTLRTDESGVREARGSLLEPAAGKTPAPRGHQDGSWMLGTLLAGEPDVPILQGLVYTDLQRLQAGDLSVAGVTLRLFEEAGAKDKTTFKGAWQNFLSLMNLLQFAPHGDFVTTKGLEDNAYFAMLDTFCWENLDRGTGAGGALDELLAYADNRLRPLLERVASAGLDLPEPGYELVGEDEMVIGSAELGWEGKKVALLTEGDQVSLAAFTRAGWKTFGLEEALEGPERVILALE